MLQDIIINIIAGFIGFAVGVPLMLAYVWFDGHKKCGYAWRKFKKSHNISFEPKLKSHERAALAMGDIIWTIPKRTR